MRKIRKGQQGLNSDWLYSLLGGSGSFGASKAGTSPSISGQIGQAAGMVSNLMPPANNDPTTNAINAGTGAVADTLMSIPTPVTQGLGAALKVGGLANKGLAAATDGKTTINNADTGLDKFLSSDLAFTLNPVFSLGNSLTKKTVEGSDKDIAKEIGFGYTAQTTDEKEYGGFSRLFKKNRNKMANRESSTKMANTMNVLAATNIKKSKEDMGSLDPMSAARKNRTQLLGGMNTNILAAKRGAKIYKEKIATLKKGGKVNVIPSGALHSRLNNMQDIVDKDLTKKGVPVISLESGNKVVQHAEIEREEIILHKDLTKKLESLYKKYKEGDEKALIEAGKLLTYEILENVEDNVGLIEKVK